VGTRTRRNARVKPRRGLAWLAFLFVTLLAGSCAEPAQEPKPAPTDENLTPAQLTGIPGLDQPLRLELQVLYARGSGVVAGMGHPLAPKDPIEAGHWLVSTPGSEFELSFHSGLVADGIVRLGPSARLLMERPVPASGLEARFRVYSGQASFFLPPLPQNQIEVVTPVGTLVTPGGAFTVTLSPDGLVLVTCREGLVYLRGRQNLAAWPGQVFQFGPLGSSRAWPLTPNQALVFQTRWLQVATEEARVLLAAQLAHKLGEFRAVERDFELSKAETLALWWGTALPLLQPAPSSPTLAEIDALWARASEARLGKRGNVSPWEALPADLGLLGDGF
jgi:hypothetical protein